MKRLICMLLVFAGLLIAGGCAIAEKREPCDICYIYQYEFFEHTNTLVTMCAECHKLYNPCEEC